MRNDLTPYASSSQVLRIAGGNRAATAAAIADALPEAIPGRIYHLNLSSGGSVRSNVTSPLLRNVTVSRPAGQPVGHFCIDLPDGVFDAAGTMGTIQSSTASGTSGPDSIRVQTTFNGLCLSQEDAEISVRLSNEDGDLQNGYFTLLIPGDS